MKRYAKLIWEHVARYTLLDFLTAVFLTGTLYLVTKLVCTVTRVGEPYCYYATQSIKLLGLIYIASILVTSCWAHIRLLGQFVQSEAKRDKPPKNEETESPSGATGGSEAKC
jgi:hypothetical protein